MSRSDAEREAGELLSEACRAARAAGSRATDHALGEAIGHKGGSAGTRWAEYRAALRTLTIPKALELLAHQPDVGAAFLAALNAWFMRRHLGGAAPDVLAAVDELIREAFDLARDALDWRADGVIDAAEADRYRGRKARLLAAFDRLDAALAPPHRLAVVDPAGARRG